MLKNVNTASLGLLCLSFGHYANAITLTNPFPEPMNVTYYEAEPKSRLSLSLEYLYWRLKDSPELIPLVQSGTLDNPGTSLVMGGKSIDNHWRSGGQLSAEYWFDNAHELGTELKYFLLPTKSYNHTVESSGLLGSPYLRIPYFDVTTGLETTTNLSFPDVVLPYSGSATLTVSNKMQGFELNILIPKQSWRNFDVTLLSGFRYWNFNEKLIFTTKSPYIINPDVFETYDQFYTKNNLFGAQFGVDVKRTIADFFMDLEAKIALGAMYSESIIKGQFTSTDLNPAGYLQNFNGGYFALPSNIGTHSHTKLAMLPEFNFKFGYTVNEDFTLLLDYTFMYISKVLFAANQMSHSINPTQCYPIAYNANATLVGPAIPSADLKTESLWVQGISLGFTYQY